MFSFQLGLFCTKWSMKLLMAFACVSRIASSKIYIIFKNQQIVISFSDFHWNKSLYGVYFLAFQNFSASVYLIFHIKLSNVYFAKKHAIYICMFSWFQLILARIKLVKRFARIEELLSEHVLYFQLNIKYSQNEVPANHNAWIEK